VATFNNPTQISSAFGMERMKEDISTAINHHRYCSSWFMELSWDQYGIKVCDILSPYTMAIPC
jgi:hypothetical protein